MSEFAVFYGQKFLKTNKKRIFAFPNFITIKKIDETIKDYQIDYQS